MPGLIALYFDLHHGDVALCRRISRAVHVFGELTNGEGGQDRDDRDCEHQFEQSEARPSASPWVVHAWVRGGFEFAYSCRTTTMDTVRLTRLDDGIDRVQFFL